MKHGADYRRISGMCIQGIEKGYKQQKVEEVNLLKV